MTDTHIAVTRRRRWPIYLGAGALGLVLVLLLAVWWLVGTAAGLRFGLARAEGITHGALKVARAQGRLAGPLRLDGIVYDDGKGTRATVGRATIDYGFLTLLGRHVHVLTLDVEDVAVALPPPTDDAAPSGPLSLDAPIDTVIDQAHIGKVTVTRAGEVLFASNSLDASGSWTSQGIALNSLALRAPAGHVNLDGKLAVGKGYHGNGKVALAWKLGGVDYAGSVDGRSDGTRAHLVVKATAPTLAQANVELTQSGNFPWTGSIDIPRFNPRPLIGESSVTGLGVNLKGTGNRYGATVDGDVQLNDYTLKLAPLKAHVDSDFRQLTLDALNLGSSQIRGALQASGTVHLDAKPIGADLRLTWSDVLLPADLAGQDLQTRGKVTARGSADRFHVDGDVAIGPPGQLARLALNLDGTPKTINLAELTLKQPHGSLAARGTLDLQPVLAWHLEASGDHFDPGQLAAGWNGALDLDLATDGRLEQAGPSATLDLRKLAGTLRKRALGGSGKLVLKPNKVVNGTFKLTSGNSSIGIDAHGDAANDADIQLAVASLGDWLPDAGGRMDGRFNVKGIYPQLSVDGSLRGRDIVYSGQKIQTLSLDANVPDISTPGGKLELDAGNVNAAGLLLDTVRLAANGNRQRHELTFDAHGRQLSAGLSLNGSLQGTQWNGNLSRLEIDLAGLPRWRLAQTSALSWNDGALSLAQTCLTAGEPSLCLAAKQDKAGNLDASYRVHSVPLALLLSATGSGDLPMRADGTLEGDGAIHRTAAGALSGQANVTSPHGTVVYTDRPDHPLVTYDAFSAVAQLAPGSQHLTLGARVNDGGSLQGSVTVTGAQQALSGNVTLDLKNLGFIELFTAELAEAKGTLGGSFQLGGTVAKPAITGNALLGDFSSEVPSAGLKLSKGHIAVTTTDAQNFRIDGSIASGKGQLNVTGTAGIGNGAQTQIAITGSQFTAVDIPAAKAIVSPAIVVKKGKDGIDVTGKVVLDLADVNVEKLPGAGAAKQSPDVVVVDDAKQQEAEAAVPLRADISVDLGDKFHLVGFGMDGRISGVLAVRERPGRVTTGQGQIGVDGVYKAYGQNLTIERGQLLFASTPVDNPGINIRAARKLNPNATVDDGQKVGLYVSGTAQRPVLTVFSEPVMEQSDALSYLITGKPLSEVKGGEGNMVGAAAQALGSAAGDLLAKKIGSRLGVDDIGVTNNDALGGSSAFTVGKYLSPKLYLSYGIGLFEPGQVITLRYIFSRRWNFEAQNATEFSRGSLNYRLEK